MSLNSSFHSVDLNSSHVFLDALEHLPEPIVFCQPDGTVAYANASARQVLKLDLGRSVVSALRPEDWMMVTRSMMSTGTYESEIRFSVSETQTLPMAIAVRKMKKGLWLWRLRDLTRQQQVEAEWATENILLARSSRHKSEFLSNMSHELRTPLTSILGFSSILKQQIFGSLNLKQETYIQQIYRSGQHLLTLINDILDLSKIEAGQMTLDKTNINVKTICQESIDLVQEQLNVKHLRLQLMVLPEVETIVADEVRMRQMLLNLLSNAIKFSSEQGKIGVQVGLESDMVTIAVRDEGIGIPLEKQHLIFKPFQQVDEPVDRRRQGTGLGLALTRHLAELHGGTVTFKSIVGEGSCFVLRVPKEGTISGSG